MGIHFCLRIDLGIEFFIAITGNALVRGLRLAYTLARFVLP